MERKPYCYHREYTTERVITEYDVFGEAYFPQRNRTLLRRLKRYEQTEFFGIDKVTISFPRDYLDETHFRNICQKNGISKYLFLQCRGTKVYISFQRELFNASQSYLRQIDQLLFDLYSVYGIFKFPIFKMSGANGDCVVPFPILDTSEKQLEELFRSRKLEEMEIFFDHEPDILQYLKYDEREVTCIGKTRYSNDYRKQRNGYPTKSFVKVYDKLQAQAAHKVEPTALENKYPVRIEFTLRGAMMSYITLDSLDCSAMEIIARLTDALAKALHDKAPWIHSVAAYPSLNPVLKRILDAKPKRRLRCSKAFLVTLYGKNQGKIPEYIKNQIKPDPLVSVEGWDAFTETKMHADTEFTMAVKPRRLDFLIKQKPLTEAVKFLRPPLYIKEKRWGSGTLASAPGPPADIVQGNEDTPDTS